VDRPLPLESTKVSKEELESYSFTTEKFSQHHIKEVQPVLSFSRSQFSTKLASSIAAKRESSLQCASPMIGSQDSWLVIETQENSETTSMEANSFTSVTIFRRHTRAEFIPITTREI